MYTNQTVLSYSGLQTSKHNSNNAPLSLAASSPGNTSVNKEIWWVLQTCTGPGTHKSQLRAIFFWTVQGKSLA